jgi:hypothetical protein
MCMLPSGPLEKTMRMLTIHTLIALTALGCATKEEDDEDSSAFGDAAWSGGPASELPSSSGSGTGGSGDTDGGGSTGGGSGSTGGGSGSTDGGSGSTDGGGSTGGGSTGGGSTDGGSTGGGSTGGGSTGGGGSGDGARDYAGGYPTNRCATTPSATGYGVGDISPDWELTDQYGDSVRLSDFCGSVVLLESSAFW